MTVVLKHQGEVIRAIPIAVDRHEVMKGYEARRREFTTWREAVGYCDEQKIGIFNDGTSRFQAQQEPGRVA